MTATQSELLPTRRQSPLLLRNQPRLTKYLLAAFFSTFLIVVTFFLWSVLQEPNNNGPLTRRYWSRFGTYSDKDQVSFFERVQAELDTESASDDNEDSSYMDEELSGIPSSDGEDLISHEDDALESYQNEPTEQELDQNEERFMAYLPHSGLSNQLGELENALVIAYMLNRTLVLPPVYLGCAPEMSWKYFHLLRRIVMRVDEKVGGVQLQPKQLDPRLEDRVQIRLRMHSKKAKAILEWSDLIDLEPLRKLGIRFAKASDLIQNNLVRSVDDVTVFEENRKYEFMYADFIPIHGNPLRAVDNRDNEFKGIMGDDYVREKPFRYMVYASSDQPSHVELSDKMLPLKQSSTNTIRIPLEKYFHVVQLKSRIPELSRRLLLFGSLFGHMRLSLHSVQTISMRQEIRTRLTYTNALLKSLTDRLLPRITPDPNGTFIGMHVRLSDGAFKRRANNTIRNIARAISSNLHTIFSLTHEPELETGMQQTVVLYIATDASPSVIASDMFQPFRDIPFVSRIVTMGELLEDESVRSTLELFISPTTATATGSENGGSPSTLVPILSLFDQPLESTPESESETYEFEHTYASTDIDAKKWTLAIPLLDQMVASRGRYVIGTRSSTFSKMIERLHELYCDENGLQNGVWGKF